MASTAQAADGVVTSGVTLRAGPDSGFPAVVALRPMSAVEIHGCIDGWNWCDITAADFRGWVPGDVLLVLHENRRVALVEVAPVIGIPVVSFNIGYWDIHYRNRPFYAQKNRFVNFTVKTRIIDRDDRRDVRRDRDDRRDVNRDRDQDRRDVRERDMKRDGDMKRDVRERDMQREGDMKREAVTPEDRKRDGQRGTTDRRMEEDGKARGAAPRTGAPEPGFAPKAGETPKTGTMPRTGNTPNAGSPPTTGTPKANQPVENEGRERRQ
jgi:uncharacterized protein YraI